jgi:hypothetical protein
VDFTVLLLHPALFTAAAIFIVSGFIAGPVNPLLVTVGHERIPSDLRGVCPRHLRLLLRLRSLWALHWAVSLSTLSGSYQP